MDIGMLWYDDDKKRPLAEKVERAAAYYKAKYGREAVQCFINPMDLPSLVADRRVGAITLKGNRTIISNHFWLGVADGEEAPKHPGT